MFALEIEFHDGISAPETILVRRTNSIVGTSEQAHVVIEGAASSPCELRLVRGLGREFRCQPVRRLGQESAPLPFLEGTYQGGVELRHGDVTIRVTSLDLDLCLQPEEGADRAAIRVLRSALSEPSPIFPAVAVTGPNPVFLSFPMEQALLVGRSRKCGLRLDASDVSSEHARIGFENGKIWVEDLASTNGTIVQGEKISGRRVLSRGELVQIGSQFTLAPILSIEDVAEYSGIKRKGESSTTESLSGYPCLFSLSDLIRPSRYSLQGSGEIRMGRDPANDIWINAPHISRQHLTVRWDSPENISVIDGSSNGTYIFGERLQKGEIVKLPPGVAVLDFCSGITAAICHSFEEEVAFLDSRGKPSKPQTKPIPDDLPIEEDYKRISSYRGADPQKSLSNWGSFVESVSGELQKPPSIFERLAEKHANLAKDSERIASEERSFEVDTTEEEELKATESPQEVVEAATRLSHFEDAPETIQFPKIQGLLAEEESNEGTSDFTRQPLFEESRFEPEKLSEEDASEKPHLHSEEEDLLLGEYEVDELESPRGGKVLRIVLGTLVFLLLGFSLMLVAGLLSNI